MGFFATFSPEKEGLRLLVEIRGVKQSHKFMDPATNMECERPLPPMPPAIEIEVESPNVLLIGVCSLKALSVVEFPSARKIR